LQRSSNSQQLSLASPQTSAEKNSPSAFSLENDNVIVIFSLGKVDARFPFGHGKATAPGNPRFREAEELVSRPIALHVSDGTKEIVPRSQTISELRTSRKSGDGLEIFHHQHISPFSHVAFSPRNVETGAEFALRFLESERISRLGTLSEFQFTNPTTRTTPSETSPGYIGLANFANFADPELGTLRNLEIAIRTTQRDFSAMIEILSEMLIDEDARLNQRGDLDTVPGKFVFEHPVSGIPVTLQQPVAVEELLGIKFIPYFALSIAYSRPPTFFAPEENMTAASTETLHKTANEFHKNRNIANDMFLIREKGSFLDRHTGLRYKKNTQAALVIFGAVALVIVGGGFLFFKQRRSGGGYGGKSGIEEEEI
jgi:hypothetical protein